MFPFTKTSDEESKFPPFGASYQLIPMPLVIKLAIIPELQNDCGVLPDGGSGEVFTLPFVQFAITVVPKLSVRELALELKVVKYTGTSQFPTPPVAINFKSKNKPSTSGILVLE